MRFHFGVSFRWKTIKKFLLPILFGLLAYFGFGGIFEHFNLGIINVYAYTNSDTSWNLTMPNYDEILRGVNCGNNGTMYDVVNDFIDNTSTTYYNLFINVTLDSSNNLERVTYYIKWNENQTLSYNRITTWAQRINPNWVVEYQATYSANGNDRVPFYTMTSSTCSNYQNSSDYLMFKNLTDTGNYSNASSVGAFDFQNYKAPNFSNDFNTFSSINNNSSYDITKWFYYSTVTHIYHYSNSIGNAGYNKNLCIIDNDTCYGNNDNVPSYYDLHHNDQPPDSTFIGYQTSLNTFYTNLNVSSFSSYNLKFKFRVPQSLLGFYQTPQEYLDNLSFSYSCGGRVDNTTYYTYENFNCSLSSSYTLTENTLEFTFNNLSSNQVLTNYDKIFVTIKPNYLDSSVSTTVYDLSYTYSLGSLINTEYKGTIYDNFTNLPLNFKMYFSSNNSLDNSMLYVKKSSFANYGLHYIGFSNSTQNQTLVIGNSILANGDNVTDFISTNVTNSIDTGIMIYQQNSSIVVPDLKLIFNGGMVISINNSNSSDTFYYIDNSGTIQSDNFVKPVSPNEDITSYDISYYTSYVSSFIDDLSSSSLLISVYTQNFYNSLPLFFQTFIFVMFILACIYFVYLLIKR